MAWTDVVVMGVRFIVDYEILEHGQVQWNVREPHSPNEPAKSHQRLLEALLRIHYTPVIEDQIRKAWFTEKYEEYAAAIGRDIHDLDEDVPF